MHRTDFRFAYLLWTWPLSAEILLNRFFVRFLVKIFLPRSECHFSALHLSLSLVRFSSFFLQCHALPLFDKQDKSAMAMVRSSSMSQSNFPTSYNSRTISDHCCQRVASQNILHEKLVSRPRIVANEKLGSASLVFRFPILFLQRESGVPNNAYTLARKLYCLQPLALARELYHFFFRFYSRKIVSYILTDAKTVCSERVSEVQNQVVNKIEFRRHNIESLWKNVLPLITKMGSKMTSLYTNLKDWK